MKRSRLIDPVHPATFALRLMFWIPFVLVVAYIIGRITA